MRRGEPALLLLNVGYFSRGAVAVSGLHGAPALCPLSGGLRPSPGDPCRRALRPEETFPQPRRTGSVLDAGPSRTAGRVSAALLQFTFSIRAATSPQKCEALLRSSTLRPSLLCQRDFPSVRVTVLIAQQSDCGRRFHEMRHGAQLPRPRAAALGRSPFHDPPPATPCRAPSPCLRRRASRACNGSASPPRSCAQRASPRAPPRPPAPGGPR